MRVRVSTVAVACVDKERVVLEHREVRRGKSRTELDSLPLLPNFSLADKVVRLFAAGEHCD